jgi:hypothetical protein
MIAAHLLHDVGQHGASRRSAYADHWTRGLLALVRRGVCAVRGHDLLVHFEPRHLSLRCVDCGWQSAGWDIDKPRFAYSIGRPMQGCLKLHGARHRAPLCGPREPTTPVFRNKRRPLVKSSGCTARSLARPLASSINSDPAA